MRSRILSLLLLLGAGSIVRADLEVISGITVIGVNFVDPALHECRRLKVVDAKAGSLLRARPVAERLTWHDGVVALAARVQEEAQLVSAGANVVNIRKHWREWRSHESGSLIYEVEHYRGVVYACPDGITRDLQRRLGDRKGAQGGEGR